MKASIRASVLRIISGSLILAGVLIANSMNAKAGGPCINLSGTYEQSETYEIPSYSGTPVSTTMVTQIVITQTGCDALSFSVSDNGRHAYTEEFSLDGVTKPLDVSWARSESGQECAATQTADADSETVEREIVVTCPEFGKQTTAVVMSFIGKNKDLVVETTLDGKGPAEMEIFKRVK